MLNFHLSPAQVKGVAFDSAELPSMEDLQKLGVAFDSASLEAVKKFAMDAAPGLFTTASITTPIQFLQFFFAKPIMNVTTARVADRLIGRTIGGSWEDEEVVQPIVERTGQARPYGDKANVPMASFNNNFERRSIVRMELGFEAQKLEIARAAKVRIDNIGVKRSAVAEALAISANDIAFNGFNGGAGHTYGILNDPNLPSYVTVATGAASDTEWSSKTFLEITADIRAAIGALRVKAAGHFNPENDSFLLAIANAAATNLDVTNELGTLSVREWIKKTYPGARIEVVPQFDGANGGNNVFYVMADNIGGEKVAMNIAQQELFLLGVQPTAKGMIEDYSNAVAGVMFTMPIGVVRYSGI